MYMYSMHTYYLFDWMKTMYDILSPFFMSHLAPYTAHLGTFPILKLLQVFPRPANLRTQDTFYGFPTMSHLLRRREADYSLRPYPIRPPCR